MRGGGRLCKRSPHHECHDAPYARLGAGGKFIQTIKHGVTMNGIEASHVREPLRPLNKDDKRELEQVVRVLRKTIADIQAETKS